MIVDSYSRKVCDISFPEFQAAQQYMATTQGGFVELPGHIKQYEIAVQTLCNKLNYKGQIHVTVDEKTILKGDTQRKPELHVDGRFAGNKWSHGWNHYCNELPLERMTVAVASNLARCKVYHGVFEGKPDEQGDLSHIRDQVGDGLLVPENEWHLLSPDCVHESLPLHCTTNRSFIRVAFEDRIAA